MFLRKQFWTGMAAAVIMLVLILDAKTALSGAQTGLNLCIRTVIPSLLPFIILSVIINSNFAGYRMSFLRPISKACGIPSGAESLLLLGILGGYPVGAQAVCEAYRNNLICKQDARRMLGFCNNAGPAFIFGMLGGLFENATTTWILWAIHIFSAIVVGCVLPGKSRQYTQMQKKRAITFTQAIEKSAKTMGFICTWIILFRILMCILQRWILWILPDQAQIWLISLTELSNGCYELYSITSQGARFIISAGTLAFGGICVYMQTQSVTGDLHCGLYFPGKVLQSCISILTSLIIQPMLFSKSELYSASIPFIFAVIVILLTTTVILYRQNSCRFLDTNCV